MKKLQKYFIFFLTIFVGMLSFCYAKSIKVRMAYLQSDIHHLPLWVAMEKGFFKELGVEVKIAGVFKAGPEIMSAFGAKALDMAYVGEAPATTAVANKMANIQVVAQVNTEGSALVVIKSISSLTELIGKSIAIPGYSTVQNFLLRRSLALHHIPITKVKLIVIKPPEMISALKIRNIDGFIAWEPYPSKAVLSSSGKILLNSHKMWPDHPCCVLVADNSFLKKHVDIVKRVLKAHIMAEDFIFNHLNEAIKIGVKYTGFSADVVRNAVKNVKYTYKLSIEGEKEYVRFLTRFEYIRIKDVDLFIRNFINQRLLNEVLGK